MAPILGIWASSKAVATDTGAMFPLQVVTVGPAGASSVSFTNIPGTYSHLQIRYIVRTATAGQNLLMTANSDTTSANYRGHILAGTGSSAVAVDLGNNVGYITGFGGLSTSSFYGGVLDILDYASTNKNKTIRLLGGADANGSGEVHLISGVWLNSSTAISTLSFSAPTAFSQYSQFALYGVKSA
jgi:hypothetical protein